MSMEEPDQFKKKVDEDWKEQMNKEKSAPPTGPAPAQPVSNDAQEPVTSADASSSHEPPSGDGEQTLPPGDFKMFLSTLSMQALMSLGEMPHPATQQVQEDLAQAQYLIDTLGMLQEKTKGNLDTEEASLLENVLYELRMKFVAKNQPPSPDPGGNA